MILCDWRSPSPAYLQRIRASICARLQIWHLSAPRCTSWLVIAWFPLFFFFPLLFAFTLRLFFFISFPNFVSPFLFSFPRFPFVFYSPTPLLCCLIFSPHFFHLCHWFNNQLLASRGPCHVTSRQSSSCDIEAVGYNIYTEGWLHVCRPALPWLNFFLSRDQCKKPHSVPVWLRRT